MCSAVIGWKDGLQVYPDAPKTLKLLHTLDVDQFPRSVFHHQGITYLGMDDGAVYTIDANYKLGGAHDEGLGGEVKSIAAYGDTLLSLLVLLYDENVADSYTHQLLVHKLSARGARYQTQWNVNECLSMCVVAREVILLDHKTKQMKVYSLKGRFIRNLLCPKISPRGATSLCTAGEDSVVVSDQLGSKIYRINVNSGELMWTSAEVTNPMSVTVYNQKWLLLSTRQGQICVLNIKSGSYNIV